MSLVTVRRSDLSGEEIPKGSGVIVRFEFRDGRREDMRLDALEGEILELLQKAAPVQKRDRSKSYSKDRD